MNTITNIHEIGKIKRGNKYEFFVEDYNNALQIAKELESKIRVEFNEFCLLNPFDKDPRTCILTPRHITIMTINDELPNVKIHIYFSKNYESAEAEYERKMEEFNPLLDAFLN